MSERELLLAQPILDDDDDKYPSSDGKPMAETGIHVMTMIWLHQALEDFFDDPKWPFIATDMFWYYQMGKVKKRVAPDAMVCMVENRWRRSYLQWNENGVPPSIVFEVASKGTWSKDFNEKFALYESLGVNEYAIFDPEAIYVHPPLQMFRLRKRKYQPVRVDRNGLYASELGFSLRGEDKMLRLVRTADASLVLTKAEAVKKAVANAEQMQKANADLQAELVRLRGQLREAKS